MVDALRGHAALVRAILASIVLVGFLFVFVFPTRTWLSQRHETQRARAQLELLRRQNAGLESEARRLRTDDEVERRARDLYGMVRRGEQAWAIVPPPAPPTTTTTAAPAPTPSPAARR